jgi:hypothetical protein
VGLQAGHLRVATHQLRGSAALTDADPWKSARPIRASSLQSAVSEFFALRVFGPDRFLLAAQALGAGESRAQSERAQRIAGLNRQIADLDTRRRKLMRTLEIADEIDDDFVRDIQERIAEVKAEKNALSRLLDAVETTVAEQENPNLLDALPVGTVDVGKLPEKIQRRLYDAFRLEIVHDLKGGYLRVAATIFGEVLGELAAIAAEAMAAETENKTDLPAIGSPTAQVCDVPLAGFEPAHPPPEGGALSPELQGLRA